MVKRKVLPSTKGLVVAAIIMIGFLYLLFNLFRYKEPTAVQSTQKINASLPQNDYRQDYLPSTTTANIIDTVTKISPAYTIKEVSPAHVASVNTQDMSVINKDLSKSQAIIERDVSSKSIYTKYAIQFDIADYYSTNSPHNTVFVRGFVPFYQNPDNVVYMDARGILKQKGIAREGNLGLGFRNLNNSTNTMLGAYMFYDRNKSTSGSMFSQLTIGGELWFNRGFLGANFYYPFGRKSTTYSSTTYDSSLQSIGGSTFNVLVTKNSNSTTDVAMIGGDCTIAYQPTDNFTGYTGAFYFHSASSNISVPIMIGPFARVRYSLFTKPKQRLGFINELSLESQIQYDQVRGTVWSAGLRLTFAFGGSRLNRMQQHMVDPALRDIDVVSASSSSNYSVTGLGTNASGQDVVVQQTSTAVSFNSALGNSSVDIIAVEGVITNANPSGTTLATDQVVTGGSATVLFEGVPVDVVVSSGGELQSTSGSTNLLKLGKNNTISDITLTMVSPSNANGSNVAIISDNTISDLGSITIDNVTSNGIISVSRNASGQVANLTISNSKFDIGSTWAPTNIPAVGQFDISNTSTFTLSIQNSEFKSSSTKPIVGVRIGSASNSTFNVTEIANNSISGTDAAIVIAMQGGNINVTGDIANNTIAGGTGSSNESGLLIFGFGNISKTFNMTGRIINNTITANDDAIDIINFGGTGIHTFNINGGIINNTMTSTGGNGILVRPNSATNAIVYINNFYGNIVQGKSPDKDMQIDGPNTTINVGQGSTGLSSANNNATVGTANSPTIIPSI